MSIHFIFCPISNSYSDTQDWQGHTKIFEKKTTRQKSKTNVQAKCIIVDKNIGPEIFPKYEYLHVITGLPPLVEYF